MSKVAIQGNASGSGVLTIAAPNTSTDRTLTLPDEAGTMLTSASSLAAANLTGDVAAARITGALNATGSAPIYACRAWVNFNGSGTVSIRASGNVSSITDNGVGDYTINFTTAMPDADYSFGFGIDDGGFNDAASYHAKGLIWSSSSFRIRTAYAWNVSSAFTDFEITTLQIFR